MRQGAENGELGAGSSERGAGSMRKGADNGELGAGSR